ncbi:histidinol dehydrogenase [Salinibius halmophilus]|uniref:histidinol dehydrogenase n=1 Tax=Salinibius halmophilus TaxID=1853216 RepID=UPI000E66E6BD|nr:histidinol dehydrogenase [Salinibius halmophilus]
MLTVSKLNTTDKDFNQQLDALLSWESVSNHEVLHTVQHVISDIRQRGDDALIDYTNKFDRVSVSSMSELTIEAQGLADAAARIPAAQLEALKQAAERIERYHNKQVSESWQYTEADGTLLGQKITPMDRVGLYVPGGTAPLASSVLMNALPAKVAGVPEVVMVTPAPDGKVSDFTLAAAHVAGINRVFLVGGAQAIAALAYGTQTVAACDKIVGPGNIFVATAKREVFGKVGIDMIAGPSEIMVVSDGTTPASWLAEDMFSQAEHDTDAQSILVTTSAEHLAEVEAAMVEQVQTHPRKEIILTSLKDRGALILAQSEEEMIELINRIAPEHLELSVAEPQKMAQQVRHAGAIFMGKYTAESLGDYCAGPNHVLPTSGTARFSSPLGVYDFQKRSSLIMVSEEGGDTLGKIAAELARGEQLEAHARSAECRVKK